MAINPPSRLLRLLLLLWALLVITKIGNPVVLHAMIQVPANLGEFAYQAWPLSWGNWLAAALLFGAGTVTPMQLRLSHWRQALPVVWLGWVLISALLGSEVRALATERLIGMTVIHLALGVGCYFLGLWSRWPEEAWNGLWLGILAALAVALCLGFEQHFGGLEATRRMVYEQLDVRTLPEEYRKRLVSTRVFACFLYPNAFAGAILLFTPAAVWWLLRGWNRADPWLRRVLAAAVIGAAGCCLVWTGSRSGLLVAVVLGVCAVWRAVQSRALRIGLVTMVVIGGAAFFVYRNVGYFQRGATSVQARFDYWRAAATTLKANPVFGTGPGSFGKVYAKIKHPDSEMARLVHNDYLQQGSDSGIVAMVCYAAFWVALLAGTVRKANSPGIESAVWLGLLGFALQSLVEFGLYIPALAWPAFLMAGWLDQRGINMKQSETNTVGIAAPKNNLSGDTPSGK